MHSILLVIYALNKRLCVVVFMHVYVFIFVFFNFSWTQEHSIPFSYFIYWTTTCVKTAEDSYQNVTSFFPILIQLCNIALHPNKNIRLLLNESYCIHLTLLLTSPSQVLHCELISTPSGCLRGDCKESHLVRLAKICLYSFYAKIR